MDTQQEAFQVKKSPVFLQKPWKLQRGAPYVNMFQAVKPPGFTALFPAANLHTRHHPAALLCTTEPAPQVLLMQAPSHGALYSGKK